MKKQFLIILSVYAIAFLSASYAKARPVSYPGGWTSMLTNNANVHGLHIHYSPTAKYSLGYKVEHWRDAEYTIHALQVNNLLKRWNGRASQGNIYLKSGLGMAHSNAGDFDNEMEPAFFTGIAADWEDRRFFFSYENRYTDVGKMDDFYMQSARVGVAPYIGDYGDLHTWLMLEVGHEPEGKDKVTVTPLVRFFKGVHLMELGVSNQGNALLNWVVRF